MATVVIPGTVQVAIEMQCSGQPVWNVIHLFIDEGFDTPASTLADVKAAWEVAAGPLKQRPDLLTMVGYHYTDLRSATGPVAFLGSSVAGARSGFISTMASAALIKLSGGTRQRSGNGRLFHGPVLEQDINPDGRTLNAGALTDYLAAYVNFKTAIEVGSRKWVVASRKNLDSNPIEGVSVGPIIATQRRRLR